MYCKKCGSEIDSNANVCPNCGANQHETTNTTTPVGVNDAPSFGYAFLGFLFPVIGLILFLVWRDQYPLRAKSCGKGALIGFIVYVVISIIGFVLPIIIALVTTAGSVSAVVGGLLL